jgi:hypothetical protein
MVIVGVTAGVVAIIAGLVYLNKSEKCHHNWTKTGSTNTDKEYTFHFECEKCKQRRSETYIIY